MLLVNSRERTPCPVCSINTKHHKCSCDIEKPFSFQELFAIFDYDQTTQSIMQQIKYKGKKRLAYDMGFHNCTFIPDSFFEGVDIALPIPLHWSRLWKRGYNQAEQFGRGIIEGKNLSILFKTDIVTRTRSTGTQTKLDKSARKRNISDAFRIAQPEMVRNKHIIIFDDVVTTCATVNACSKVLLSSGCASVKVCALARD
jgi:ComF family protein